MAATPRQVTGLQVARHPGVAHDDVPGLAMLSDDSGQCRGCVAGPGHQPGVVLRVIEGGADVVAHAAVNADVSTVRVGADVDVFDGADFVQRDGARSGDGATGLDRQRGGGKPDGRGFLADDRASLAASSLTGGGSSVARYEMPSPPPRSTVAICAVFSAPNSSTISRSRPMTRCAGEFEAVDVEDLRADVAVQADESQVLGGEDPPHRRHRRAAGDGQPELLVLVRGRDELVGVRLDSHRQAHQHVLDNARVGRDRVQALDLGHRVHNDVAHTDFTASVNSATDLLLPWNVMRSGGKPARSATASSPPVDTSSDRPSSLTHRAISRAQEGFSGVVHVAPAAEGRRQVPAPRTEVVLVDDEQRSPVFVGEACYRHSARR